jgi:Uma2 family endonuclease
MHEPTQLLDPDDLLQLPGGESYELVDGRPVEKPMGAESDLIAAAVITALNNTVRPQRLGYVFGSQTGFRCFPARKGLVRKPDVSFVIRGRFPDERIPKGDILLAPDLAVEVVSPNDLYEEVELKVNEYLSAGVRLVWVVSPSAKTILVRRPNKSCTTLDRTDTLNGEDVLPGFSCSVAELFT